MAERTGHNWAGWMVYPLVHYWAVLRVCTMAAMREQTLAARLDDCWVESKDGRLVVMWAKRWAELMDFQKVGYSGLRTVEQKDVSKAAQMVQHWAGLLVYLMAELMADRWVAQSAYGSVARMVERREKKMAENSACWLGAKSRLQKLGKVAGKLLPIL